MMRVSFLSVIITAVVGGFGGVAATVQASDSSLAAKILDAAHVQGGLIVHLGCGDGKKVAAAASKRFTDLGSVMVHDGRVFFTQPYRSREKAC